MGLRNAFEGLATEATLADVKAAVEFVADKINTVDTGLDQPLTDAQLRSTAVDVIEQLKTPAWGGGQSLSVGAVSTVSAPINATAIDITVTTPCWVHAGLAPTAIKPSSYPLFASKLPYRLPWTPGHKLAVIRDEFDGFIYISPLEP